MPTPSAGSAETAIFDASDVTGLLSPVRTTEPLDASTRPAPPPAHRAQASVPASPITGLGWASLGSAAFVISACAGRAATVEGKTAVLAVVVAAIAGVVLALTSLPVSLIGACLARLVGRRGWGGTAGPGGWSAAGALVVALGWPVLAPGGAMSALVAVAGLTAAVAVGFLVERQPVSYRSPA